MHVCSPLSLAWPAVVKDGSTSTLSSLDATTTRRLAGRPPTPLILFLPILFLSSDGDAAAQPHRAGDLRRGPPRGLLRGRAGVRARPFAHLLGLPGRLAPPPELPRRRAPPHRAGPRRGARRGGAWRRGRAAVAAAPAPPPRFLRRRLRRVRDRAQGARHRGVREDAAGRAHAPGLLLRPRRQWPRGY